MESIHVLAVVTLFLATLMAVLWRLTGQGVHPVSSDPPQPVLEWLVAECEDAYKLETALDNNAEEGWELYGIYMAPTIQHTKETEATEVPTGLDLADENEGEDVLKVPFPDARFEPATMETTDYSVIFMCVWFRPRTGADK